MRWPWRRPAAEIEESAQRIVEAERGLREARLERAKVDRRKDRADEFAAAIRQALNGKNGGNGDHAPVRR